MGDPTRSIISCAVDSCPSTTKRDGEALIFVIVQSEEPCANPSRIRNGGFTIVFLPTDGGPPVMGNQQTTF